MSPTEVRTRVCVTYVALQSLCILRTLSFVIFFLFFFSIMVIRANSGVTVIFIYVNFIN